MTVINKQKFLAELGKLLTFMYEDDRMTALAMYTALFDDCADEQALLQMLVSPTRQAVVIARAYDAAARKLQASSLAREGAVDEAKYQLVLENLRDEAIEKGIIVEAFDEPEAVEANVEANDEHIEAEATVEEAIPTEEVAEPTTSLEVAPVEDAEKVTDAPEADTEAPTKGEAAPEDQTVEAEDNASETAPADENAELEAEIPQNADAVNDFVESIKQESIATVDDEITSNEEAPLKAIQNLDESVSDEPVTMVRKPKIFLLILYILFAVPITLVGVVVMIIPTILLFAFAFTSICIGGICMSAVFSGFAVIADILVVLGVALVACALALFLLWIFLWFTVDILIGFVIAVFKLGNKWCYKEVPAV